MYEHVDPDNKMPLRYALACINKEATLTFGEQSMNPDVCGGAARYKDGELPRRIVLLVEAKAKNMSGARHRSSEAQHPGLEARPHELWGAQDRG